ncbi:MAG: hypothetical protein IH786_05960 [Proteobacteria bacterium]|nr:hypothetical protein [Pseudomonadota bacterium]
MARRGICPVQPQSGSGAFARRKRNRSTRSIRSNNTPPRSKLTYRSGAPLRETAFESGDRVFAFSIAAVAGETYINIYGRDISREHAAKQELAEKDAQLWVALDNLPGGTALYDRDLNYVLFNAQYSQLCEFPDGLVKVGVLDDPASR